MRLQEALVTGTSKRLKGVEEARKAAGGHQECSF
jgi:hypothetical protein